MKNIQYILLSITALFILACTEIPPEIPKVEISGDKVVLIEDFTGVKCTNCPTAAQEISRLHHEYGDKVISVSIHAPKYSAFTTPHLDSKYDFRIDKADDIAELVENEIMGLPSAMFDRHEFEGDGLSGHIISAVSNYEKAVTELLSKNAKVLLSIDNAYNEATREVTTTAHIRPVENLEGDFYITFMLVEDNIVDLQTDKQAIIEEYVHNSVLRDVYSNNPTGDKIAQSLERNELIEVSKTVKIPELEEGLDWNKVENMRSIVVIHRRGSDISCLQADAAPILD